MTCYETNAVWIISGCCVFFLVHIIKRAKMYSLLQFYIEIVCSEDSVWLMCLREMSRFYQRFSSTIQSDIVICTEIDIFDWTHRHDATSHKFDWPVDIWTINWHCEPHTNWIWPYKRCEQFILGLRMKSFLFKTANSHYELPKNETSCAWDTKCAQRNIINTRREIKF